MSGGKGLKRIPRGQELKQIEANIPVSDHTEVTAKSKAAGISLNNFLGRAIRFVLRHWQQFEDEELDRD